MLTSDYGMTDTRPTRPCNSAILIDTTTERGFQRPGDRLHVTVTRDAPQPSAIA